MKKYFFGSYFKLQSKDKTLALIPSYSRIGKKYIGSLQIITHNNSYVLDYPYELYKRGKGFDAKLDSNIFNKDGINLNINRDNVNLVGNIKFESINKLNKNIMGPFKFIPFMECIHSVHSIKHNINGKLVLNNEEYNFDNSLCYIEGDRGRSFPKVYTWTQSLFDEGSIMLSVADIPFGLFHFTGVIGFINYNGKTIRIATYKRAKALKIKDEEVIIKQGKYKFTVKLLKKNSFDLKAPKLGQMARIIKESAECIVSYKLEKKNELIFEKIINNASMEYEYKKEYEFDNTK